MATATADTIAQIEANTAKVKVATQLVRELYGDDARRTTLLEALARIALSDDDGDTRERHVREALATFVAGIRVTTRSPGTAPNVVDDNSIERGGVSGWNR